MVKLFVYSSLLKAHQCFGTEYIPNVRIWRIWYYYDKRNIAVLQVDSY